MSVGNNRTWIAYARYQGAVSAALVLGGVDVTGPHLHAVRTLTLLKSAICTYTQCIVTMFSLSSVEFVILSVV